MSRLTDRRKEKKRGWQYKNGNIKSMTNKLGQLEDIEEELGVDLVKVFNALKNGIESDDGNHYRCMIYFDEDIFGRKNYMLQTEIGMNYYPKHYGKIWALTKEDLENE